MGQDSPTAESRLAAIQEVKLSSILKAGCLHAGLMALNIRNPEADRLAGEVAALSGQNKTDAIIQALQERLQRLDDIALRNAARTRNDNRTPGEILGHDTLGLPGGW